MKAIKKMLKGKETMLGRAIYFSHNFCTADKELGEKAAKEYLALLALIEELEDEPKCKDHMYDE